MFWNILIQKNLIQRSIHTNVYGTVKCDVFGPGRVGLTQAAWIQGPFLYKNSLKYCPYYKKQPVSWPYYKTACLLPLLKKRLSLSAIIKTACLLPLLQNSLSLVPIIKTACPLPLLEKTACLLLLL